jgi:hypothetical protein
MNPFRRILLGTGCLPDELRGEVMAEGVLLLEEGLRGSVTYRHYRAPGRRANWSKSSLYTALAVTTARVVVASGRGKTVDCPRDQDGLEVSTDGPDPPAARVRRGQALPRALGPRGGAAAAAERAARRGGDRQTLDHPQRGLTLNVAGAAR